MTELIHSLTARWPGHEEARVFRAFANRLEAVLRRGRAQLWRGR